MFHERTNHVEIDCHVVRDKVLAKVIKLIHVRTQCQLADLLTKVLSYKQFSELVSKMGKKVAVKQLEESTTAVKGVIAEHVEQHSFKQIVQAVIEQAQADQPSRN